VRRALQARDPRHRPARRPPPGKRVCKGRSYAAAWGDSAIAHPFSSLVVTFHFLDVVNHLPPEDPWYARLRDVYLEAWGSDQVETFELAQRVGTIAYAFGEIRHRDAMPEEFRPEFDRWFPATLRRAVAQTEE
jgi:hypothetical protein